MKQTFLLLIILGFSAFAIHACKKTPPPEPDNTWGLPNATQEGANTFACRVNGENWVSEKNIYNMGGGRTDSTMGVRGRTYLNSFFKGNFEIGIISDEIIIEKAYRLNDSVKRYGRFSSAENVKCFTPNGGYGSLTAHSFDGELLLSKVDTTNKILSGTFWFNILTDHCDTMKVTDGRFDINYY